MNASSRRIDTPRFGFAALLILLGGWGYGLDTELSLREDRDALAISVEVTGADSTVVEADLRSGYSLSLEFFLRIYRKKSGIGKILGDEMLFEAHPVRTGRWDPFSRSFEIRFADGSVRFFPDKDAFTGSYFTLKDYPLPMFSGNSLYALVKVRFQSKILNPPLNVFTAFFNKYTDESSWKRREFGK